MYLLKNWFNLQFFKQFQCCWKWSTVPKSTCVTLMNFLVFCCKMMGFGMRFTPPVEDLRCLVIKSHKCDKNCSAQLVKSLSLWESVQKQDTETLGFYSSKGIWAQKPNMHFHNFPVPWGFPGGTSAEPDFAICLHQLCLQPLGVLMIAL